ncbi:MAG: L,D-transpeptidase/peptidoglycan binding protein [Actinomycetota bacterium]|nr:L,D-transpeptidase/peptidoglycan binding protein [Actinomycetota bacterium]
MSLRRLIAASCLAAALASAPAQAQQPPPPPPPEDAPLEQRQIIAPGVTAGGIDLGGQSVEQASQTLELALREHVSREVVVRAGGREFRLTAEEAELRFNPLRTAKRAYYHGRDVGPGEVGLALRHSSKRVRRFAEGVDREVRVKPKNASVRITLTQIFLRKGKIGRTINEHELARVIDKLLADPALKREIRAKLNPDRPEVRTKEMRRRYRTVVTVDRDHLVLRLFKRLRHERTYDIAIGQAGFDTPTGLFNIQSKQVNPVWNVPNRPWAGSLAGQTIPGGAPNNPLKARWLGVNGAVGIHGTAEEWSIGSRASHGCIRMRVSDVIELYRRVPLGTPVLIR